MITYEEHVLMSLGPEYTLEFVRFALRRAHRAADERRETMVICEEWECLYVLSPDEIGSDRVVLYVKPFGYGY